MAQPEYTLPAEWEPQDGVMLTWPNPDTDWRPYIDEITSTYLTLSKVIAARERLVIAAKDAAYVETLLSDSLTEAEVARVTVVACDINDTWARDHGPIILRSGKDGSLKLLDFRFNGWGEKFSWQKDNAITSALHGKGLFSAALESHDDFVLEGGSIESDGKGTVFTTAQCLLAPRRNQPLARRR